MSSPAAAMSGVPYKLQDAAATGNGNVLAIPSTFRNHSFIVTAAADVTSGAVAIETSNDPDHTGTWAVVIPIGTVSNPLTVIAGANLLINFFGLLNFVRARISTTIAGGAAPSVTVEYNGSRP